MIVWMYGICCVVWGSTWAVIRLGLTELPPFAFAASRMTLVAILLLPIVYRHATGRRERLLLWAIGAFQFGVAFAFVFAAEAHVDSGLTAVLFGTYPLFQLIVARVLLPSEVLRPQHLVAIGLGFIGLVVMHAGRDLSGTGVAALYPVCAAAIAAVASVSTKRFALQVPPLVTLGVNAQSGAAVLWVLHAFFERGVVWHYTERGVMLIVYLAVLGSIVAYGCLLWLLSRIPLAMIGFMTFVEALFGVLVGMAFLAERPEPRVIAGAAVVLVSIVVAVLPLAKAR